jgi:hypothetical protein
MIPEMFHVKHFCPIETENLTNPDTSRRLEPSGMAREFGKLGS